MPGAQTPSLAQAAGQFASISLAPVSAASAKAVATSTVARYVSPPIMVPGPALTGSDPRRVVTPLDVDALTDALDALCMLGDWQTVINGLRLGFDTGASIHIKDTLICDNHSSCNLDPSFIDRYIISEQAADRYSPPYEPSELESIIGPFRTSPLGLVPKPHSDSFRMIQDLSFPRNDPLVTSVNSSINTDDFPTAWGTFDDTCRLILSLPDGSQAATCDITAAYRLTPIRPNQQHIYCVSWRGKIYVDRAVCFGMASSAGIFGAVADLLIAFYKATGIQLVLKWVDDFIVFRRPGEEFTEEDFVNRTAQFRVPWSLPKTRPFASRQKYLGFIWDLINRTVSLPEDKLIDLGRRLKAWLGPAAKFNQAEAARLHGKLVHISCIYPIIRPFLRSISRFASTFRTASACLRVPDSVTKDIRWIQDALIIAPSSVPLAHPEPVDIGWWGDASTSWGIGVVTGRFWAAWAWAPGFKVGTGQDFDIGWAEAVAVELGLRMALHHGLMGELPAQARRVLARSDNSGIVDVINKGRSRSAATNTVLRHLHRLLLPSHILLTAQHIPGKRNITDSLSRGDLATFHAAFPSADIVSDLPLPAHLAGLLTQWFGPSQPSI